MSKEVKYFMDTEEIRFFLEELCKEIKISFYSVKIHNNDMLNAMDYWEIPHLGINISGDHQSESYFVLEKNVPISFERMEKEGNVWFSVGQYSNPDSIVFWPGGRYDEKRLVRGHFGTISDSDKSKGLMKMFEKVLKKYCKKIKGYYIGKQVLEKEGLRLITIQVNQDEIYDFKI